MITHYSSPFRKLRHVMSSFYVWLLFFAGLQIAVGISPNALPTTVGNQSQGIVVITRQSSSQVTEVGSTIRFHCAGQSENNDGISIEWLKEHGDIPSDRSYNENDGSSSILIIRDVNLTDEGTYVCRVSDGVNIASQRINLTVRLLCGPSPTPKPIIAPVDWSGKSGDDVRLECFTPQISSVIQWSRIGYTSLPADAFEENGVLILPDASPSDSGFYVCTATIFYGVQTNATASVSIRSLAKPLVDDVHKRLNTTAERTLVELTCLVTGNPTPCVTWTKAGKPVGAHTRAVKNTLIIDDLKDSDQGTYECRATNSEGSSARKAEVEIERTELKLKLFTLPREQSIPRAGGDVVFNCFDESQHNAKVIWTRANGMGLPPNSTDTNGKLKIPNVQTNYSGEYVCEAVGVPDNTQGRSVVVTLIVGPVTERELNLKTYPEKQVVKENQEVVIQCSDEGPLRTKVHWIREDGVPLPPGSTDINGKLEIPNVQVIHSGNYTCEALGVPRDTLSGRKVIAHLLVEEGCIEGEFQCRNRNCVKEGKQCDGFDDCSDNSDEENCGIAPFLPGTSGVVTAAQELNLKTYPDYQVVKESQEAAILCRDEGLLRVKVHWVRHGGAPLPPGSTDVRGRLEMPNLQVIHSGNYYCEALGVPEDTPGRRVVAHVLVEKKNDPTGGLLEPCRYDEEVCTNGDCIPRSQICDGKYDCTDGADEFSCLHLYCKPEEFRCANKECVSKLWRCDGDKDCGDGSDEENCGAPPSGSQCAYYEYQCASNQQCILKSFHCDGKRDCFDGSDEIGCTRVQILTQPPQVVILNIGETFNITCTASGIPIPEISWQWNFRRVPQKCVTTSMNGTGTLVCPSISIDDQGSYSCEGLNTLGFMFAAPSTILEVISNNPLPCPGGIINTLNAENCISCFCFGVTSECSSADFYTYQLPVSFDQYNIVHVNIYPETIIQSKVSENVIEIHPVEPNGIYLFDRYADSIRNSSNVVHYLALPESYYGNRLEFYGGYFEYTVSHRGRGTPNAAPSVILVGNNYVLVNREDHFPMDNETKKVVRFFPGNWVRIQGLDEDEASRQEIMLALAHIDNILIKVQYDDGPINTTITDVFIETADIHGMDQGNTTVGEKCPCPVGDNDLLCEHCTSENLKQVSGRWLGGIERCNCPTGYKGLSCEDCAVGYTRGETGPYLPKCELCNCNGHSKHCNPDTGVCENCTDHTTGDHCDLCEDEYEGDATRGTLQDCQPRKVICACDIAGSLETSCDAVGQCKCKKNVEGSECNRCRQSTFGLSADNFDGCTECFCSNVTNECHESSLSIDRIPTDIYNAVDGFTLTDSDWRERSVERLDLKWKTKELGYIYPPSSSQIFWSLPSNITGNRVTSYGGNLYVTQRINTLSDAVIEKGKDVVLIGNGITLYWMNPNEIRPGVSVPYIVPLIESAWMRLTQEGNVRNASRTDLMIVLSDLEAILVRATHSASMNATYISDVSLDTAVDRVVNVMNDTRAKHVEICRCPSGYTGTSCETCAPGHYRDLNDKSRSILGACNPCPCNGNEVECKLVYRSGAVKCICITGFRGRYCSEHNIPTTTEGVQTDLIRPKIIVTILGTPIQYVEIGNTVKYECAGISLDNETIKIEWTKESGELPHGRSDVDTRGNLIIEDVELSDGGVYFCHVSDGISSDFQKVGLAVGIKHSPMKPLAIIQPRYLTVQEGNPVEFHCLASGNPQPELSWIRVRGEMNPDAVFENGTWSLPSARTSDKGEYKCVAENSVGTTETHTMLYVTVGHKSPVIAISPKQNQTIPINGQARFECMDTAEVPISHVNWTRMDGKPFSKNVEKLSDGVLHFKRVTLEDEGSFICSASNKFGSTSLVAVLQIRTPPAITITPTSHDGILSPKLGESVRLVCNATGQPKPSVVWIKSEGLPLQPGSKIPKSSQPVAFYEICSISYEDEGPYTCYASNDHSTVEKRIEIRVKGA